MCQKQRIKKPFNPILGETYELVTNKFRFFAEQVNHHPPVTAFVVETEGFKLETFSQVIQSFSFGGGSGALNYKQIGCQKYSL
jgi:hypothetical protein